MRKMKLYELLAKIKEEYKNVVLKSVYESKEGESVTIKFRFYTEKNE